MKIAAGGEEETVHSSFRWVGQKPCRGPIALVPRKGKLKSDRKKIKKPASLKLTLIRIGFPPCGTEPVGHGKALILPPGKKRTFSLFSLQASFSNQVGVSRSSLGHSSFAFLAWFFLVPALRGSKFYFSCSNSSSSCRIFCSRTISFPSSV